VPRAVPYSEKTRGAHQRPHTNLVILAGTDLTTCGGLRQLHAIGGSEGTIVIAIGFRGDELRLHDDAVERFVRAHEIQISLNAEPLRLEPIMRVAGALSQSMPGAGTHVGDQRPEHF